MTGAEYQATRRKLGSLRTAAGLVGCHWMTLHRRETGALPISREAALAIAALVAERKKVAGRGGEKPRPKSRAKPENSVLHDKTDK